VLGLLLVVTFIANYLATTLPNTMGQNDLQHELAVENQVAQLSATMQAAALANAVGAQVTQPVSLGSQGTPPFAGPDAGYLTALSSVANTTGNYPQSGLNFTLLGPTTYLPPTGGPAGGIATGCTTTSTSITCSGTAAVVYNFTGALGNQPAYSLTFSGGGSARVNFSTSGSTITVTPSATTLLVLNILGSNDTVTVTVATVPENILIFGNYDTLRMTGSASPSTQTNVVVVGNHDTVTTTALSGTNTIVASVYGSSDAVNPGTLSGTNKFGVYFNGFNPSVVSASCPVDNLSSSDTVAQPSGGSGTFAVTYNNTVYSGSGTNGVWSVSYRIPTPFACPFTTTVEVPFTPTGAAGFVVHLENTYAPAAEVAYDQGAVVYAQPGGLPIFIVSPPITLAHGVLTLFVPWFTNRVPGDSGTGTADVSLRLLSTTSFTVPANGYALLTGSQLTFSVVSQYAAAWYAFFHSTSNPFSSYVTCTGSANVCTAMYNPGGAAPLGTVTVTIPVSAITTLNVLTAVYSVSVL